MSCDQCGAELKVGEWPWCPHGTVEHFGEDPMEPYVDEHLTDEPGGIEITTRGQRRAIMDREHLVPHRNRVDYTRRLYFFT